MHRLSQAPNFVVPAGMAVSAISAHTGKLIVMVGRAWITISGDPNDYWLEAGEAVRIPASRRVVIEADHEAVDVEFVRNLAASASSRQRPRLAWLAVCAGLVSRLQRMRGSTSDPFCRSAT